MIDGYHHRSSPPAALLAAEPRPGLGPGPRAVRPVHRHLGPATHSFDREGTVVYDEPGGWSFGRVIDGGLLDESDVDDSPLHCTFTEITPETFHWQGRIQDADGTWRLEQDMRARRTQEAS